ncbi:hypothetical protein QR680_014348 [Steinernema hermaphroditum]|uniref:Uncharacterized protein n=1 Tax=Steinernema hermaphroditum TaxID=289476 RepID=A0AA39I8K7_9BILA|nr:hypothetical protein QR680_014348 [Steinernema hermaphroditum]
MSDVVAQTPEPLGELSTNFDIWDKPRVRFSEFKLCGIYRASWDDSRDGDGKSSVEPVQITEIPELNKKRVVDGLPKELIEIMLTSDISFHDQPLWIQEFFRKVPNFIRDHKDKKFTILATNKALAHLSMSANNSWKPRVVFAKGSIENEEGSMEIIVITVQKSRKEAEEYQGEDGTVDKE